MMFVQFMMSSDKILVRSAMKCWVESEMVRGGRFVHRSYVCLKVLKRASWYWAGGALIIPADTGEYRGTSIFGFQVTVVTSPAAIFFLFTTEGENALKQPGQETKGSCQDRIPEKGLREDVQMALDRYTLYHCGHR